RALPAELRPRSGIGEGRPSAKSAPPSQKPMGLEELMWVLLIGDRLDHRRGDRLFGRGYDRDPRSAFRIGDLARRRRRIEVDQAGADAGPARSVNGHVARLRGAIARAVAGIPGGRIHAVLFVLTEELLVDTLDARQVRGRELLR